MKICHISDSHLGAGQNHPRRGRSGLKERQEDVVHCFQEAIGQIIRIRPDLCIHSGDLFDSVRPINRIIAVAAEQLYMLAQQASIPTVIISGNHDAPNQPHLGCALEILSHIDNLHVACASRMQEFNIGRARICALPHCLTSTILREQLTRCQPEKTVRHNILVMHGVAAGMPEFSMADLGEQELPTEIMKQFDYTALGHYHNYRQVGERAWYAGSTERLSLAEKDVAKGFCEVDLEPFGMTFHSVGAREMVDLPEIDVAGKRGDQLAEIIRDKVRQVGAADKTVRITITGVTEETLKTVPAAAIADLKQESYSLNIRFVKEPGDTTSVAIGRGAIGQLDIGFVEYLSTVPLDGFDRERLKREAIKYLAEDG
ncbi:MAG: exonuclease SbcCD subunit D [Candidatus Zixiibacteriota bacterium]